MPQDERIFRFAAEALPDGLVLVTRGGEVVYANGRFVKWHGAGADLRGKSIRDLIIPVSAWEEYWGRCDAPAPGYCVELELPLAGSALTAFELTFFPLPDREHLHAAVCRDISRRRAVQDALRTSEARLLLAQKVGQVGSWEVEIPSQKLTWSPQTYRIFGFEPYAFEPTLERFMEAVHPEDRALVQHASERALIEGGYRIDHRIVRPDGSDRFVHEQAEIVFEAGQPVRRVGTVQDITDQKLLEDRVRHAQKMEAIGQLAGGVAHDFNNILTVILGCADLVLSNDGLDLELAGQVHQIALSAERAAKLTRQLLTFSRRQPLQLKPVDIPGLFQKISPVLHRLAGDRVTVRLDAAPDLPRIRLDAGMLEQALTNLTLNAAEAMPEGGVLTVNAFLNTVSDAECQHQPLATPGEYLCIEARDTGRGILPTNLPHIFEPFFTTKEFGQGPGLGLASVYGIVQQHFGWIAVESEPGAGSLFRLHFPLHSTHRAAASVPEYAAPGGKERVLIVEDDAALRSLACTILSRRGYKVEEASSGPEALERHKGRAAEIDLLLTDMVMPDRMTGLQLSHALKAEHAGLRVLFTSGYSVDWIVEGPALKEGINFIPKPYTAAGLCLAVRRCLDSAPV